MSTYTFPRPHPLPVQKSGIHPWDEWGGRGLYQSQGEETASELTNQELESGSYNPTGMMDPKYNNPPELESVRRRRKHKHRPRYCLLKNSWQLLLDKTYRYGEKYPKICRMGGTQEERFYYDRNVGKCLKFTRNSCPELKYLWNKNDFGTQRQCVRTCIFRYYTFLFIIIYVREGFSLKFQNKILDV